ncbi:MAG: hypothetical protein DVB23_000191 [Verrucomicrobia bacterium]|nr:MAG: hypothetical protein DVB23_000191 [Verrucomicrobiota bacterium]
MACKARKRFQGRPYAGHPGNLGIRAELGRNAMGQATMQPPRWEDKRWNGEEFREKKKERKAPKS